jgi:hypothetical protein
MNFPDLAKILGRSEDGLRVSFCREKLSIRRSEDVQRFLVKRLGNQKTFPKRTYQTAKHLARWRFVKSDKVSEIDQLRIELAELQKNLVATRLENAKLRAKNLKKKFFEQNKRQKNCPQNFKND